MGSIYERVDEFPGLLKEVLRDRQHIADRILQYMAGDPNTYPELAEFVAGFRSEKIIPVSMVDVVSHVMASSGGGFACPTINIPSLER